MTRSRASKELIWATELGARWEARKRLEAGQDREVIRRAILTEYREVLAGEDYVEPMQVALLAAAQRAIDEALARAVTRVGTRRPAVGPARSPLAPPRLIS